MSEEFEKQTKELLKDVKGPTAKAITIFAMNVDTKLDAILEAISANKIDTDAKIETLKKDTDSKFSKLKVVLFFSEHTYILWLIVLAILIVFGFDSEKMPLIAKLFK